jgi:hypothetical protein
MKKLKKILDLFMFITFCFVVDSLLAYFILDNVKAVLNTGQSIYYSLIIYRMISLVACIIASMVVVLFTNKTSIFCMIGIILYVVSYFVSILVFISPDFGVFIKLSVLYLLITVLTVYLVNLLPKVGIATLKVADNFIIKIVARIVYVILFFILLYIIVDFSLDIMNHINYKRIGATATIEAYEECGNSEEN